MADKLDVITLWGLRAKGIHGVLAQEHNRAQEFVVDVTLWLDTSAAAGTDQIDDTVSYADVARDAVSVIRGPSVRLIETLATKIAQTILRDPQIAKVEVTVHKPEAPIGEEFSDVAVTISRARENLHTDPIPALPTGSIPALPTPEVQPEAAVESDPVSATKAAGADDGADSAEKKAESTEPADITPAAGDAAQLPPRRASMHRPATLVDPESIVLSLGGNVGNVPVALRNVVSDLLEVPGIEIDEVSPLLRTRAVVRPGTEEQDDYWNAVILAHTTLAPRELLKATAVVEMRHGRIRRATWGPRTVDIDIIQYGELTVEEPGLILPHPRAHQRAFVLAPWALVDPDATLHGFGPIEHLLQQADDRDGIIDAVEDWLEDPESVQADSDAHLAGKQAVHAAPTLSVQPLSDSPSTVTSRLERVPEASRQALSPGESDVVWRQLWDKWARPHDVEARPFQVGTATPASESSPEPVSSPAPAPEAPKVRREIPPASSESAQPKFWDRISQDPARRAIIEQLTGGTAVAPATPTAAPASRSVPAPAPTAGQAPASLASAISPATSAREPIAAAEAPVVETLTAHTRVSPREENEPLVTESESERLGRLPKWMLRSERVQRALTGEQAVPALPSWDFGGQPVRVVDDESAGQNVATVNSDTGSVLQPELPDDLPRGPRNVDRPSTSTVRRSVTVRPTVTGAIPVGRQGNDAQ